MGVSKQRQEEVDFYLSKENLEKLLPIYSANYIATKYFENFKTCATVVINKAKKYGIKTHDASSSAKLDSTNKQKQTSCLEKYGFIHNSKSQKIKDQKKQKALDKYGVENPFMSEEIKEQIKQDNIVKYGVPYPHHTGEKTTGKRSVLHQEVENILIQNQINFESEVSNKFCKYNSYYDREYNPTVDILIETLKIVVECNGDIWHANPKIYKPNDIITLYKGPTKAKEIWEKDNARNLQIESFGYKLIVVWESEFHHNKQIFEKEILNAVNKNQKNI